MKEKIIIALALLCVIPLSAQAITVKEACINSTHQINTYNYSLIVNSTTSSYNYTQIHECLNGCSTTLGKCRPNSFLEISYMSQIFAGLLVLAAFSIWLERKTNTSIDVPLLILISLLSIIIGTQDVFTSTYRILFFLFALIPLVLLWFARREVPDDETGEPIDVEVN